MKLKHTNQHYRGESMRVVLIAKFCALNPNDYYMDIIGLPVTIFFCLLN